MLSSWKVGEVVADVVVATIGHTAFEIDSLVGSGSKCVGVFRCWGRFFSEKRPALHVDGNVCSYQAEQGRREVDKPYPFIGLGAGFMRRKVSPFFGEPYDEGHMRATVVDEAFATRHDTAMI